MDDNGATFSHILYISASSGSVDQLFDDRPLRKDKFEAIASVTTSYWLIETSTSNIVAAGAETGTARLHGTVGGQFNVGPVAVG